MPTSTLANRITTARADASLSIAEVSSLTAVKQETYLKWESGAIQPRANKLVTLAGVLNVVPAWLLDGDNDFLQDLSREEKIVQLSQRIEQMKSMQTRMITMLDELMSDLDDASSRASVDYS
ncbi:MAG: transcriptional regulator with XRE-family HTH domain [Gammaproteobacteria bacterium]|jgi:transcriptional regulator with XRE-family HTH domain